MKKIAADFEKSPYVIYDRPLPTEDSEIFALTKQFADTKAFYAVFLQNTPDMIGYICFHTEGGICDVGYCFHSAFHKKGYAYESISALMENLHRHHSIQKFTAGIVLQNVPSRKLLERLGFTLVGTETLSFYKDAEGKDITFEGGIFSKSVF